MRNNKVATIEKFGKKESKKKIKKDTEICEERKKEALKHRKKGGC